MGSKLFTKEEALAALNSSGGFIAIAAEKLGVQYQALYRRIQRNPSLKSAVRNIEERHLDIAEATLISCLKAKQPWAVCFYLKCKGKKRGYIEHPTLGQREEKQDHLDEVLAAFKAGPIKRGVHFDDEQEPGKP